ncbi:MAG TPA: lytic transglycosylase domain-containing protein [Polyangia bacterium]|nr:lytic transglycosylase domain-containing protein [Polyangia bacterium]
MLLKSNTGPRWSWLLLAGALVALPAVAADARITRARAEAAAARAGAGSLPVDVDDALLAALNQAVASPENRARLKKSLERMQAHRAMVTEVLSARGLPTELAAVALMESGFDNDVGPAPDGSRGAGLWQLIPTTARAHGLKVDRASRVDERLDPRRATEGAASLLANLHQRFGDWRLAITAYSRGTTAVDKLVADAGTRDGRLLQQRGLLGRYLTNVNVGVLLLRDPGLLD